MKQVAETATVSLNDICDRTSYAAGSYYMLVQQGIHDMNDNSIQTWIVRIVRTIR